MSISIGSPFLPGNYLEQRRQEEFAKKQLVEVLGWGTTIVGNDGVGETNLVSVFLEPNLLKGVGQSIGMEIAGDFTASGNRQIKAYLGSTTIFDSGVFDPLAAGAWIYTLRIMRVSALSERCLSAFVGESSVIPYKPYIVHGTEDLRSRLTLKLTANLGAANTTRSVYYKIFLEN